MARIVIFGDVNQNFGNLRSLLRQSSSLSVDRYVCHGDVPNKPLLPLRFNLEDTRRCIRLMDKYYVDWILGNHEKEVMESAERLGLPKSLAERMGNLPEKLIIGELIVKHSSPEGLWRVAKRHSEFDYLERNYPEQRMAIFGHSHRRCYHRRDGGEIESAPVQFDKRYDVSRGLHLINTGSLHRLASFNWHQGYVVYDSDKQTITFKKVRK